MNIAEVGPPLPAEQGSNGPAAPAPMDVAAQIEPDAPPLAAVNNGVRPHLPAPPRPAPSPAADAATGVRHTTLLVVPHSRDAEDAGCRLGVPRCCGPGLTVLNQNHRPQRLPRVTCTRSACSRLSKTMVFRASCETHGTTLL